MLSNDSDIICITETSLNGSVKDCEVFDSEYSVYRRDRENSASKKSDGGGVLVAVRAELQVIAQKEWQSEAEDI